MTLLTELVRRPPERRSRALEEFTQVRGNLLSKAFSAAREKARRPTPSCQSSSGRRSGICARMAPGATNERGFPSSTCRP